MKKYNLKFCIMFISLLTGCSQTVYFTSKPSGSTVVRYSNQDDREVICKTPCKKEISWFNADDNFVFFNKQCVPGSARDNIQQLGKNFIFIAKNRLHSAHCHPIPWRFTMESSKIRTCEISSTHYVESLFRTKSKVLDYASRKLLLDRCLIDENFLIEAEKKYKDKLSLKIAIDKEGEKNIKKDVDKYTKERYMSSLMSTFIFDITYDELFNQ